MLLNSAKLQVLYQGGRDLNQLPSLVPFEPFSSEALSFLAEVSGALLKDPRVREFPDIVTFAFFCRKANLARLRKSYGAGGVVRLGRGVTFHIAPSNVPINFAYTLAAGLLAGNACVVRVSQKPFAQTDIVCDAIRGIMERPEMEAVRQHVAVIRYEHDEEITAWLSGLCDVRVIWGGDETIRAIRRAELPPRAFDLTFADRYSICVIQSTSILETKNLEPLAQRFYNDTYLFDQNACSSPRLLIWVGTNKEITAAKELFWSAVLAYLESRYTLETVVAVDKWTTLCRCAIGLPGARFTVMENNLVHRIQLAALTPEVVDYRCPGGSFLEYDDTGLDALPAIVTRKYQTLATLGFNNGQLAQWIARKGLGGIDRVVPLGKTADFSLTWDGYDLIYTLSRVVSSIAE